MLAPTLHQLRLAEHRERVHSELVLELVQWMPETLAFLLTGLEEHFEAFKASLASLRSSTPDLQGTSVPDPFSWEISSMAELDNMLNELDSHADQLHVLRSSFEQNRPLIMASVELLNPLALEFLGEVNGMIDAVSELPASEDNKRLAMTLTGLRYAWAQMMSHLRVFVIVKNFRVKRGRVKVIDSKRNQ